jgi:hypothetical protein
MNDTDKAALELAMNTLSRDPKWGPALDGRLEGKRYMNPHPINGEWIMKPQVWEEVAEFAANICQTTSLNLRPWEFPPCRAKDGDALKLRDRMVAAGVSIWHPDPIAALRKAEAPPQPCDGEMSK